MNSVACLLLMQLGEKTELGELRRRPGTLGLCAGQAIAEEVFCYTDRGKRTS